MALSGTVVTNSYDNTRYYKLEWTATQSAANNTSTISWTLSAVGGSGWYAERTLSVSIDGSTVYSKSNRVERTAGVITNGTKTITHNSNGSRSFTVSLNVAVYGTSINCTGSSTFTLDTIGRSSSILATDGTLGIGQTISITKQSSSFTHTLKWNTFAYSGTIAEKSSATSFSFTPPLYLANGTTNRTWFYLTYELITYNGSTQIGSVFKSVRMDIPETVKPSCTVSVSDGNGYSSTYGGYIQNCSSMNVTVTYTPSYSSEMASCSVTANGKTATLSNSLTYDAGLIDSSGTNYISATVTDQRGRSGTASTSINVIAYSSPSITFTLKRCDADGNESITGSYCKVTYTAKVTALSNKNGKTLELKYKKTTDSSYTTQSITMSSYEQSGSTTFMADDANSYNVQMVLSDNFKTSISSAELSTGFSIMHIAASGKGIAFGKISQADEFEVGMDAEFSNPTTFDKTVLCKGLVDFEGGWVERLRAITTGSFNDLTKTGRYLIDSTDVLDGPGSGYDSGYLYVWSRGGGGGPAYQEFINWWYGTTHIRYRKNSTTAWTNWVKVVTANDIPSDYIMNSGISDDGWNYKKWSNGDYELWRTKSLDTNNFTAVGSGLSGYYQINDSFSLDSGLKLTSIENVQMTVNGNRSAFGSAYTYANVTSVDTTNISFKIVSPKASSTSETIYLYAYVRARWTAR